MRSRFIFLFLMFFMVACYDKVEIDKRSFVTVIGIDKIDTDYSDEALNRFEITYSIPNLKSESGDDKVKFIKTTEAPVLFSANESLGSKLDKRISFDHTKAIILGKDVASDKQLLSEIIDSLERNLVLNHAIPIVISKTKASDILKTEPETEAITGLYISNLFENIPSQSSSFFYRNLGEFLYSINEDNNALVPLIAKEDEDLILRGCGIIKDGSLVGFLDEDETKGAMWVREEIRGGQELIVYNDIIVPLLVTEGSSDISFHEENNELRCDIYIRVEGNILEYSFEKEDDLFDEKIIGDMEILFEENIKRDISNTILKLQNEYEVDVLGIGSNLKKYKYNIYKDISDWDIAFKDVYFNIDVDVYIRRIGAIK